MAIVSSSFELHPVEIDGRRYVTESHTDSTGTVHNKEYLAAVGADHTVIMNARAVQISIELAEAEAQALIDGGA